MTDLPNRDHLATTNPVPNWNQHFAALGGLYDVVSEMMGTQAQQALTIAAGAITPSRGSIMVDTEAAAASDDLTTIAQDNLPDGRWLYLRSASGARTVVVKHGAGGAGQVLLVNAADFAINATDKWLLLERYGTAWREVDRGYGADLAGMRAYIGGGNLLGAIEGLPLAGGSLTGALNMAKGTNVASASTCDIWTPGDGNLLHVTGTTAITSLGAAPQAGAHRVVVFDGILTLTNGANLILPGAANYTTAAGDMAFVFAETTTQHRLRILKADGSAVVGAGGGGEEYMGETLTTSGTYAVITGLEPGYNYAFVFDNIRPASGDFFATQVGTGGTPTWLTSGYNLGHEIISSGSLALTKYAATDAGWISLGSDGRYTNPTYGGVSGHAILSNPAAGYAKLIYDITHSAESSHNIDRVIGAGYYRGANTAITAIRFFFANLVALNGGKIHTYRRAIA